MLLSGYSSKQYCFCEHAEGGCFMPFVECNLDLCKRNCDGLIPYCKQIDGVSAQCCCSPKKLSASLDKNNRPWDEFLNSNLYVPDLHGSNSAWLNKIYRHLKNIATQTVMLHLDVHIQTSTLILRPILNLAWMFMLLTWHLAHMSCSILHSFSWFFAPLSSGGTIAAGNCTIGMKNDGLE